MKNLLALIGLAVVIVGGLGWYLGWYQLGTQQGVNGHRIITVDVDTKKAIENGKNGVQKVSSIISNETKGTSPVLPDAKQVEGQTTGIQFDRDGGAVIVLPKIEIKTGN